MPDQEVPPNGSASSGDGAGIRPPPGFRYPSPDAVYHRIAKRVHEIADPSWGSDIADDVVSWVQSNVFKLRKKDPECLTEPAQYEAFVERAVRNRLVDVRRAEANKEKRYAPFDDAVIEKLASDPEGDARLAELGHEVNGALDAMDPELSVPLIMSRELEYTYAEIASELGYSVPTLKRRIAQALAELERQLVRRGLGREIAGRLAKNVQHVRTPAHGRV
jgi:RNA polymerase sigma factor (sigma-70 family)